MAINWQKVEKFRKEIEALQRELKFGLHWNVIEDKLLDMFAKNPDNDIYELRREIKKIFKPEFSPFIDETISKFGEALKVVNEYYDDLGDDLSREMRSLRAIEKVNQGEIGNYGNKAIRKLAKLTSIGLTEDLNHKELTKLFRKGMGTDLKIGYEFHAETWGRTFIKGYGQACKNEKANIAEVFWFDYAGFLRETTRLKCRECLKKEHLHINEIKEFDNEVFQGQKKPFAIYCGGWRCVHWLEPNPFIKKEYKAAA